jgi:hypothetical protein
MLQKAFVFRSYDRRFERRRDIVNGNPVQPSSSPIQSQLMNYYVVAIQQQGL